MKWPYNMYYRWHHLCEISTFKSPEMLAPARIPVAAGKKMANTEKKFSLSRKSGGKFSKKIFALKKKGGWGWIGEEKTMKRSSLLHFITTNVLLLNVSCGEAKPSYNYN